eukprot:TRINITY_DN14039_c0_g1_i1.p1 TRINITY_DN14039_c0_g1~~TRINITY_DN14039_c0_g1_i1.p1  ORF type:complete len:115 (+),score=14.41 TRINITY_DN14039_c0_g1_i1:125-469(+)
MLRSLVGSEMCIRDSQRTRVSTRETSDFFAARLGVHGWRVKARAATNSAARPCMPHLQNFILGYLMSSDRVLKWFEDLGVSQLCEQILAQAISDLMTSSSSIGNLTSAPSCWAL